MNKPQNYIYWKPDFEIQRSKIENFLLTFVDKNIAADRRYDHKKYMIELVNKKYLIILFSKQ